MKVRCAVMAVRGWGFRRWLFGLQGVRRPVRRLPRLCDPPRFCPIAELRGGFQDKRGRLAARRACPARQLSGGRLPFLPLRFVPAFLRFLRYGILACRKRSKFLECVRCWRCKPAKGRACVLWFACFCFLFFWLCAGGWIVPPPLARKTPPPGEGEAMRGGAGAVRRRSQCLGTPRRGRGRLRVLAPPCRALPPRGNDP